MNQMFPNLYNLLIPPNVTEHFRVSTHAVCLSCLWSESSGNLKEAPLISGPKPICFQFTGADDEKHESRASIKIELISALFNRLPYVGINNDKKFSVDALFFYSSAFDEKSIFPRAGSFFCVRYLCCFHSLKGLIFLSYLLFAPY